MLLIDIMKIIKIGIVLWILAVFASVSLFADVAKVETIMEIKEFHEGQELIAVSIAVYNNDSDAVLLGPVVFAEKGFLSNFRLRFSSVDKKYYVLLNQESISVEGGGIYVVGRNVRQPRRVGEIDREAFAYLARHGFLHYQVNRDLAFNEEFLSFFR